MFTTTPFALQNGSHSADLFRQAASSLVPPGGGIITAGDLAVAQTGTPSMNVSVGVGRCWIPGTNVGNVVGGNFSSQAMYYGQNASAYTAAVTTADSVNPRIDVVYAAVQDSQYAGTTNAGVIAVAAGAPTSGASYPANAPVLPANSIPLAWINVAANASSIINGNITNIAPAPLFIPSTTWTSYTPSWAGWINLGAGYVSTGSYLMIGPKLCAVRMKMVAGSSGTNLGTGSLAVSLPFTSASDQATLGQGEWLGSGTGGGIQNLILSNPASNNQAAIFSPGSGNGIAVTPGNAGYGYGPTTEVHATITYRIA